MKNTTLLPLLLIVYSFTGFLNQGLFAQLPANAQKFPKPVFKDEKFFFYNPSFFRDTTNTSHNSKRQTIPAPCYHCAATLSAKRIVVTGGPIVLYITSQDATCGYSSGNIIVQAANGIPPYTYSLDGIGSQLTGNFPIVGAGVHTVTVTDASGVTATSSITLTNILPGPIIVPFFSTALPSSCNSLDGVITLQPSGGTPPYTYSMDLVNFQTSNAFSNLASSLDYYFYVKDANGCIGVAVAFAYFSRFCLYQFNMSIGDYVCGNNGSISVTETGLSTGVYTGPYLYSLDGINYQATGDFNNLSAGRYNLYTKDNSGNINIYGFNLAENCLIIIQYIAVSAACKQNDGSLAVTAANGTAPYTYTIDGINYQSSNTFNALAPGNYYITAKDANGITSSLQAAVYDRCPVVEAVSSAETCVKNDGSITAAGFKGSQPYQYSMDGVNFKTNNNFAGLVAGTYTITIRDALGFTGTVQIAVKNDCLNIYASSQPSTCGNINGSINLTVTNGTAPYQYSMDGVNFQASSTFNSLASGPYTITVKDADGLTSSIIVTVTNTVGPKINAIANSTSCLNNDGSITALNIGGTTPFQYSIDGSNFQNSGVFPGLDTGMKTLIVMDANGCNDTLKIIVPLISNLTVTAGVSISICQGTGATLNASTNGSSFTWSPSSSINNTASLKPVASPPITTKYYLTASKGICSKTDSLTIFVSPAPVANAGLDTSTCYGKNIQLQGSGGIDYLWSPVAYLDNPDISNPTVTNPVKTITFYLTVTDMNNCKSIQPASVTVKIEPPAKVFAGNDTSVIINQPLQLNAMDVNNSGFDSYVWSPASGLNDPTVQDPIALITNDIIYTVTASTPDGCEGTSSIAVKVFTISDIFVPNAFTPNGDGHNDILKAILIGIKEFKYFAIYDRWGQRVFYTKNQGLGWDGMISGQLQNTSTYVWMAGGIDFKGTVIERKGFVILIR